MTFCGIVILILLTGQHVFTIELYVEIGDDKGRIKKYNISEELEDFLTEEPPFKVPHKRMDAEYKFKLRSRREAKNQQEVSFTRDLPKCHTDLKNYHQQSKGLPIQLMYSVQSNDNIKLTCHYCGDSHTYGQSIQWKKLHRKKSNSLYMISDVKLDMHDNDALNRVFIDEEYSLKILNATKHDTGTYFCHDLQTHDPYVRTTMNAAQLKNFFTRGVKFKVYYNIEVVLPTDIPVRRVDRRGRKFPKPLGQQFKKGPKTDNLLYYSDWGEWTPCSVCDQSGEQKRLGTCTAKILNPKIVSKGYEQIYYILRMYKTGLPCRSTLFEEFHTMHLRDRPDEVEFKKCYVACDKGTSQRFSNLKINGLKFNMKFKIPIKRLIVASGDRVDMKCPGSNLDTLVYWINGTRYISSIQLRERTRNRMDIDAYNVFVIYVAIVKDSGFYTCWYHGKRVAMFNLIVAPPPGLPEWLQHLIYLCYGFTVDFWLFLIMICVRHKYRLVQRNKPKPKMSIEQVDDTEEENTDLEEFENQLVEREDGDLEEPKPEYIERGDAISFQESENKYVERESSQSIPKMRKKHG